MVVYNKKLFILPFKKMYDMTILKWGIRKILKGILI